MHVMSAVACSEASGNVEGNGTRRMAKVRNKEEWAKR